MNIANTTGMAADLKSFGRQHLVCPNCGDTDSRFVFASAAVDRRNEAMAESPPLIAAAAEEFPPEHLAASDAASSVLMALLAQSRPPMLSHSELSMPADVGSQSAEPLPSAEQPVDNNAVAPTNNKFAELLQTYMAKWRLDRSSS